MPRGETTLNPTAGSGKPLHALDALAPRLRILFHSDLRRIGEVTAHDLLGLDATESVGRLAPAFYAEGAAGTAAEGRPLDDPCISRSQLTLSWSSRFAFTIGGTGVRSVELSDLEGRPAKLPVPPQTVIAIGDRVLLLLGLGFRREGQDRLGLVGESEAIWSLRESILDAASSDSTVLVHGESGTGKELVARAIHGASPRAEQPLLVVNCAAIPEHLLESELFGHVRGAFTGADAERLGLFRAAGRGTLFLDEIGDLPLALQGKLLRVLQERSVRPVGDVEERPVQARVVAATNRELAEEVAGGTFREDLYYRLTPLSIAVPPLRERRADIPLLFWHFFADALRRHPELERFLCAASRHNPPVPLSLLRALLSFRWPGNVRHLHNVVERICAANLRSATFRVPEAILAELEAEHAPKGGGAAAPSPSEAPAARADDQGASGDPRAIDDVRLLELLEEHDYVQRRVAQLLGVSHSTIDRRMRELGLRRPADIGIEELEAAAASTGDDLTEMARLLKVSRRGLKLRLTALGKG